MGFGRRRGRFVGLAVGILALVVVASAVGAAEVAGKRSKSGARLDGTFNASVVFTAGTNADFEGVEIGATATRTWKFAPICETGACDVVLERQTTFSSTKVRLRFKGKGVYRALEPETRTLECGGKSLTSALTGQLEWTVRVTGSKKIKGVLTAVKLKATGVLTLNPSDEALAIEGCVPGVVTWTQEVTATRASS